MSTLARREVIPTLKGRYSLQTGDALPRFPLVLCFTRITELDIAQFLEQDSFVRVLRAHHDRYFAGGHGFGDAGDELARFVDGQATLRFVFFAVCRHEKHALRGILFVDFELVAFEEDVVADGQRAVLLSRRGVGYRGNPRRLFFCTEYFD